MVRSKEVQLSGWGRFPVQSCFAYRPENEGEVREILATPYRPHYIAYGLGRSYGDAPLNVNGGVLFTSRLNKFLSFDDAEGILECEAGVAFEEILRFFVPRGFFLPVTPGTKYVTVGGAIANDVHGKNHHIDGCISEHVLEISLLTASGEIIRCSREHHEGIFWATVGGIGLTGVILTAKLKLFPIETAYCDVRYEKAKDLDHALELFEQSDDRYQYSVAWIDCLAKGSSLGKCVLMRGNHATREQLAGVQDALSLKSKRKLNMTVDFPSFLLNPYSIRMFNALYYAAHPSSANKIVDFDSFFYPLDAINNWNRLYGKKGFIQYQAVFPGRHSRQGLIDILQKLSQSGRSSFLAILKSSGEQGQGLLSFPMKGYTLALDIPIKDQYISPFLRELDEIVVKYGGRVYLAKDSELSSDYFYEMYPRFKQFNAILDKIDPDHVFSSSMSRRLNIRGNGIG